MPVQSTKDAKYWQKQIELSIAKRQRYERWWDANLKMFAPMVDTDPEQYGSGVHTHRSFTAIERKKADQFYQKPDVTLQPTPLMDGPILTGQVDPMTQQPIPLMGANGQPVPQTVALQAHQQIVNEDLGEDGIDATEMMDAVLFDIDCTQGTGFTKMGYEQFAVEQPDPRDPTGQAMIPVPIVERCFWEHFSGKQAVIPHNFRKTEWDKAPYLGMQFELPLNAHNRKAFNLPPDFEGAKSSGKQHYDHGDGERDSDDVFTGVELWYRSHLFRDDIIHPEHLTQLVLVDGIDEPVIERDSPYQTLDDKGQLSHDSLIGFPIHPFSVRKLTDSAYVPSDGTMIGPLERELDVFRNQQINFRDISATRWGYRASAIPPEAVSKIVRSNMGGMIALPDEAFPLDQNLVELPQGSMPRENILGQQSIDDDIARTLGVDAAGAGVNSQNSQTATETQVIQANANARLDKERGILLKRYIKGVNKFSTLKQRYTSVEKAAQIVGPQLAQIWDVWRKTVPATLAFTAMPDSALRVDQAVDRKASQELYSFLANDPFVNRQELLTGLLRKFHLDPTKIVKQPEPPKPEPPKLALSFKGEDLVGPQAPIVLEILMQQGIKISPAAVSQSQGMLAQMEQEQAAAAEAEASEKHGGKVAQQESLSKHASDRTGGMQNTGAPAAMGGGGGMLQ
jgi:hypothetical protein